MGAGAVIAPAGFPPLPLALTDLFSQQAPERDLDTVVDLEVDHPTNEVPPIERQVPSKPGPTIRPARPLDIAY
jgi:hypothetical protein